MDEPTSQLDPLTESQLADATRKLMTGRTVITIAHRLNTVYQADRILVLQEGAIVEEGSHQELINKDGVYRELVQAYTGGVTPIIPMEMDEKGSSSDQFRIKILSSSPSLPLSLTQTPPRPK